MEKVQRLRILGPMRKSFDRATEKNEYYGLADGLANNLSRCEWSQTRECNAVPDRSWPPEIKPEIYKSSPEACKVNDAYANFIPSKHVNPLAR